MKNYLESLSYLERIDVKNLNIDLEKFKLINMSGYDCNEALHINKSKYYRANNYAKKALEKGYGIYCDGVVYYLNNLDASYFNVSKISELQKFINNTLKQRRNKNYAFIKYLTNPINYRFVENYILMYNKKIVDREWVRKRLVDKVSDVEYVLNADFPEAI